MLGEYFVIRHKATGQLMPQCERRGYSYWNPSTNSLPNKITGSPRLFASRKSAVYSIANWQQGIMRRSTNINYEGEMDEIIDVKHDGRSKDDVEIIMVKLIEVE